MLCSYPSSTSQPTLVLPPPPERYEVLLDTPKKRKDGPPNRNHWITVSTQYMSAGPAGYAMLRYADAPKNQTLPPVPTPQPGVKPWDKYQYNKVGGWAGGGRVVGVVSWLWDGCQQFLAQHFVGSPGTSTSTWMVGAACACLAL